MEIFQEAEEVIVKKKYIGRKCDKCEEIIDGQQYNLSCTFERVDSNGYALHEEGWQVEDLCRECASKLRDLLEDLGYTTSDVDRDLTEDLA